eukprot:ANDGO_05754.mRNA.1 Alkaline ceramidase YDC1
MNELIHVAKEHTMMLIDLLFPYVFGASANPLWKVPAVGYWGAPTSSVDWCELNYEFHPMIAEFFNTWSNLSYIIPSVLGLVLAKKYKYGAKFFFLCLACLVIGIGSFWFHATLSRFGQDLDEFSMLLGVALYFYGISRPSPYLAASLTVFLLSSFLGMVVFHAVPNLFRVIFGLMVLLVLARYVALHNDMKNASIRRIMYLWVGLWLAAFSLWLTDIHACGFLSQFQYPVRAFLQLHAYWHVLTGCACYLSLVLGTWIDMEHLEYSGGRVPRLCWIANCIPYVASDKRKQ